MKKFIAILKRAAPDEFSGSIISKQFDAVDYIDAAKQLKELVSENYTGDYSLSVLEYYEIAAAFEADLKRWYSEFEHNAKLAEQQKELAELERLKKEI